MEAWFQKYGMPTRILTEKHALKMMKHQIEKAIEDFEKGGDYCEHVVHVNEMAKDFLELKGYTDDEESSAKLLPK